MLRGTTTLHLNQATLREAIALWLKATLHPDVAGAVEVVSVTEKNGSAYSGGIFEVVLSEKEPTP